MELRQWNRLTNNPWEANTVVLYDETGEATVVDCGCFTATERDRLRDFLTENKLRPVVLLNTHLHIDHLFGNAFMHDEYGLTTRAHAGDAFWLTDFERTAGMFGVRGMEEPPEPEEWLEDGERVRFGRTELEVIHVPGHSPGGVCFYAREAGVLVAGDVLFAGSVGRADLPGGDSSELLRGIRKRLLTLPDETIVIPGHGEYTTIGEEKRTNPFFRNKI